MDGTRKLVWSSGLPQGSPDFFARCLFLVPRRVGERGAVFTILNGRVCSLGPFAERGHGPMVLAKWILAAARGIGPPWPARPRPVGAPPVRSGQRGERLASGCSRYQLSLATAALGGPAF